MLLFNFGRDPLSFRVRISHSWFLTCAPHHISELRSLNGSQIAFRGFRFSLLRPSSSELRIPNGFKSHFADFTFALLGPSSSELRISNIQLQTPPPSFLFEIILTVAFSAPYTGTIHLVWTSAPSTNLWSLRVDLIPQWIWTVYTHKMGLKL